MENINDETLLSIDTASTDTMKAIWRHMLNKLDEVYTVIKEINKMQKCERIAISSVNLIYDHACLEQKLRSLQSEFDEYPESTRDEMKDMIEDYKEHMTNVRRLTQSQ